jgi:hypothetical protein
MAYAFTTVFVAFFLFDIFGDEVGYELGLVPSLLFIAVSAVLYVTVSFLVRRALRASGDSTDSSVTRRKSIAFVDVEEAALRESAFELSVKNEKREGKKMAYVDNPMLAPSRHPMRAPNRPKMAREPSSPQIHL